MFTTKTMVFTFNTDILSGTYDKPYKSVSCKYVAN